MKLSSSSKPITSPGRTEKFPPPLMRFLRSNVSSKSRGRSRTTPLFMRKLKCITSSTHQGTTTLETQEPSSPKVTCIGQVRVRRSKNNAKKISPSSKNTNKPTKCISKSSFCSCLPEPKLPRWVFWFGCRSVTVRTESSKNSGSTRFEEASTDHGHKQVYGQDFKDDKEEEGYERGRRSSVSLVGTTMETATVTTPPKNALLLTRCRSAPFRSSSLACRFWGENEEEQKREENKALEMTELMLLNSRDSTSESRGDQEDSHSSEGSKRIGVCAEEVFVGKVVVSEESGNFTVVKNEGKTDDNIDGGNKGEKLNDRVNNNIGSRLRLMRCKSEPSRRGLEKFDPQSIEFWQLRRMGNTENCTPHVLD